jgi:membrane-associated phospholipid phosphatase
MTPVNRFGFRLRIWFLSVCVVFLGHSSPLASASETYPYELDTGREIGITGTAVLLFGAGQLVGQSDSALTETDLAHLDRSEIWWLDRGTTHRWSPTAGKVSDWLLYSMIVAPFGLLLSDEGKKEPWTISAMYAETQLLNLGAMSLMKNLFSRTRPFVYNEDPRIPLEAKLTVDARRSFPSGHTSTTFAAATFLSVVNQKLHPGSNANPWVWGLSYAAATTTAVLRNVAGKHYPTDILAGAALGVLVGWVVPQLHELDSNGDSRKADLNVPLGVIAFSF